MYKRTEELKALLNSIPSFESAIYDDGILKDLRFEFLYEGETFLLHYKLDYSKPHVYRKKKTGIITEVKEFIVPKHIKQEMERITNLIKKVNEAYYPLIPSHRRSIGILTYESKYFNEYAPAQRDIDYLSVTYDVWEKETVVAKVEMAFRKNKNGWETDKVHITNTYNEKSIRTNVCLFENEILKRLNSFVEAMQKDVLFEAVDSFLKGTE